MNVIDLALLNQAEDVLNADVDQLNEEPGNMTIDSTGKPSLYIVL